MQQFELIDYIPVGIDNAISNYELSLAVDMKVLCINRKLKQLVKYKFIKEIQSNKHYKSKKYYKEK